MHLRVRSPLAALGLLTLLACPSTAPLAGQSRPAASGARRIAADLICPAELGIGVSTKRRFCDVLTGRDAADGIVVKLPARRGTATLSFELHNRHTYSEELVRTNRAFTRYTATVGVLTPDNTLLARGVVESEFRTAADLLDRIEGGAAAAGVKAVAPSGTEHVAVSLPPNLTSVVILGEKLTLERLDGTSTYAAPGRPVAVISNVQIEYRPAARR